MQQIELLPETGIAPRALVTVAGVPCLDKNLIPASTQLPDPLHIEYDDAGCLCIIIILQGAVSDAPDIFGQFIPML